MGYDYISRVHWDLEFLRWMEQISGCRETGDHSDEAREGEGVLRRAAVRLRCVHGVCVVGWVK